jgi:hypothetical protein
MFLKTSASSRGDCGISQKRRHPPVSRRVAEADFLGRAFTAKVPRDRSATFGYAALRVSRPISRMTKRR